MTCKQELSWLRDGRHADALIDKIEILRNVCGRVVNKRYNGVGLRLPPRYVVSVEQCLALNESRCKVQGSQHSPGYLCAGPDMTHNGTPIAVLRQNNISLYLIA